MLNKQEPRVPGLPLWAQPPGLVPWNLQDGFHGPEGSSRKSILRLEDSELGISPPSALRGDSWHEDASHAQPEALHVGANQAGVGLPPAWRKGNFTSTRNVGLELVTLIS